jgi:hypothetical protein
MTAKPGDERDRDFLAEASATCVFDETAEVGDVGVDLGAATVDELTAESL